MAKTKSAPKATTKLNPSIIATKAIIKASVAEKAKTRAGVRGPKGVALTSVITLLAGANPKRPTSKAYERFASYKDGLTVQQALDSGLTTPDLAYDAAHGYIAIEGYAAELVVKKERPVKEPKAPKCEPDRFNKSVKRKCAEIFQTKGLFNEATRFFNAPSFEIMTDKGRYRKSFKINGHIS